MRDQGGVTDVAGGFGEQITVIIHHPFQFLHFFQLQLFPKVFNFRCSFELLRFLDHLIVYGDRGMASR